MSEGKAECYKHELYTYVENEKTEKHIFQKYLRKNKK